MNNLYSVLGRVTRHWGELNHALKMRFLEMEMLSLKIRHKKNRPPLLNVLGTILYRRTKVILLASEARIEAHSFDQVTQCSHLQEFLLTCGIKSRNSSMTLCDLAFAIVSDLPSHDIFSWTLHMSRTELFAYTAVSSLHISSHPIFSSPWPFPFIKNLISFPNL